mgnify:CR=1 FL=1
MVGCVPKVGPPEARFDGDLEESAAHAARHRRSGMAHRVGAMIRLPKRPASADSAEELDDGDLLDEADDVGARPAPGDPDQTHSRPVDAEPAAGARVVPDAVPVGQVMASLEAEMSRALSDDKAAWVPRTFFF